jgi:hypothetical protein
MPRPRLRPRWHLGDQQAALGYRLLPSGVLGWISNVDPAGDHGDRPGFDRSVMRRTVDPARQS